MSQTLNKPQRQSRSGMNKRDEKRSYYLYLIPGLVAFVGLIGFAFGWNIYLSLTKYNGTGTPKFIGFENYINLFQDVVFWESFLHAFVFIIAMSLVPTGLGVLFAALLFDFIAPRFGNGASAFMRGGFYLPQIIPLTVTGIMWVWLVSPTAGVINTFLRQIGLPGPNWLGDANLAIWTLSVIMVWLQIGYTIVIFMSGMSRLDPSLGEAAQIDGASWLQRFRVITLAQLGPEIGVVLLTTTVAALKVFAPVYVMTQGGPGTATQVPAYFSYFHFFTTHKVGYGAAVAAVLAILLTALAVVILFVQNKQNQAANKR
jgi:raffinose/stachyose/melibiose transport system permease protein